MFNGLMSPRELVMKKPLGIMFLLAYSFYAAGIFAFKACSESGNPLSNLLQLALWLALAIGLWRLSKWAWILALVVALGNLLAAGYLLWLLGEDSGTFTSYAWKIELRNLLICSMLFIYLSEKHVRQVFFNQENQGAQIAP